MSPEVFDDVGGFCFFPFSLFFWWTGDWWIPLGKNNIFFWLVKRVSTSMALVLGGCRG